MQERIFCLTHSEFALCEFQLYCLSMSMSWDWVCPDLLFLREMSLQTDTRSDYLTAIPNLWPFRWCNRICFWFSCLRGTETKEEATAGFLQLCSVTSSGAQTLSLSLSNLFKLPCRHTCTALKVKLHHASNIFSSSSLPLLLSVSLLSRVFTLRTL